MENYFVSFLNVNETDYDQESELYSVESFVLKPSILEVENSVAILENYKTAGVDGLPTESIKHESEH